MRIINYAQNARVSMELMNSTSMIVLGQDLMVQSNVNFAKIQYILPMRKAGENILLSRDVLEAIVR